MCVVDPRRCLPLLLNCHKQRCPNDSAERKHCNEDKAQGRGLRTMKKKKKHTCARIAVKNVQPRRPCPSIKKYATNLERLPAQKKKIQQKRKAADTKQESPPKWGREKNRLDNSRSQCGIGRQKLFKVQKVAIYENFQRRSR